MSCYGGLQMSTIDAKMYHVEFKNVDRNYARKHLAASF